MLVVEVGGDFGGDLTVPTLERVDAAQVVNPVLGPDTSPLVIRGQRCTRPKVIGVAHDYGRPSIWFTRTTLANPCEVIGDDQLS